MFNPSGLRVFSFFIQKSSRRCSRDLKSSLSPSRELSCSIIINFLSLLKLWEVLLKCWQTGIDADLLESFRWLFIRRLTCVSDLPMYCKLHCIHSSR